ncbi:MAG TPA: group 1 glycosyl transferase [Cyanobacteria bacterium UBA8156]|nr:group 1 glycosyl transferase [Cyanobacteria bacterium UBA8156]
MPLSPDLVGSRPLLARLLVPDAAVLVEVAPPDETLARAYQRQNPRGEYRAIAPFAPLPAGAACVVISDLRAIGGAAGLAPYREGLAPDGQLLVYVPNAQYWRRLQGCLTEQEDWGPGFWLPAMPNQLAAHVHVWDVQWDTPPLTAAEAAALERFLETLRPLLPQPDRFAQVACIAGGVFAATLTPPARPLLVHTFISAPIGCDRVRVLEPDRLSQTIPGTRIQHSRPREAIATKGLPGEEKVFIWQRALLLYPQDIQKQKLFLQNGFLIVMEHDDDPYFWPENADNKFLVFWTSHCVQTSTEPLAQHLTQFNPNVKVFRNHLSFLPPRRSYPKKSTVTLFFGALNRKADWEPLMPALNRVLKKYQNVSVQVVHDREFFDALATKHKEFQPFCPYERYQEILSRCDIGILPLLDTQFNRMKSDLKFLEHAGFGTVALASPTVYAESIVEGETGLLFASPEEFETKLVTLIQDGELRQRLAHNAYDWVAQSRLLSQHYRERRDWYLAMRDDLPRLNAELRERCPTMFD